MAGLLLLELVAGGTSVPTPSRVSDTGPRAEQEEEAVAPGRPLVTPADRGRARTFIVCPRRRLSHPSPRPSRAMPASDQDRGRRPCRSPRLFRGGEAAAPLAFKSFERRGSDSERSKKFAAAACGEGCFGGEVAAAAVAAFATGPTVAVADGEEEEEEGAVRPMGWIVSHKDEA